MAVKNVCFLLILAALSTLGLSPPKALADKNDDLDACAEALEKAGATLPEPGESAKSYGFGKDRVVIGNAGNEGFVCLLTSSKEKLVVSDLLFGLDVVGIIADSRPTEQNRHLLTLQSFRGGSNAKRQYHVLYSFRAGKIWTSLKIPRDKELAIDDYKFSEKNLLTFEQGGLSVSERVSIMGAGQTQIYQSSRTFKLVYSEKFGAFIEGTALCLQDIVGDKKTWQKKGMRVGYRFVSGFSDVAPLAVELVRDDGKRFMINDLAELHFLTLEKEDR